MAENKKEPTWEDVLAELNKTTMKPTYPKDLNEVAERESKDTGAKLRNQMFNYGDQKDKLDKLEFAKDVADALVAGGAVAAGAKNINDRNAKTNAIPKAKENLHVGDAKQAAGAEGLYIPGVTESLDTRDMSANEFERMKRDLRSAADSIGGVYGFDNSEDLSKLFDEWKEEDIAANDKIKLLSKGQKPLMNTTADKMEAARKAGYETTYEHQNASRINQRRRNNESPIEVEVSKPVEVHKENKGKTFEVPNMVNKNAPATKDAALQISEMKNVEKVLDLMEFAKNGNSKIHEDVINKMFSDLNLSGTRKRGVSNETRTLFNEEFRTPEMNEAAKKIGTSKKLKDHIDKRAGKIERTIIQTWEPEKIESEARRAFGDETVDMWMNAISGNKAEKIGFCAKVIGKLCSAALYSDEKQANKDEKEINKVVKANKNLLSGKEAPNHADNAKQMWQGWLDTFDANKMDNEDDYSAYMEAYKLLDDEKNGRNILTDSGNTHGIQELMTNPRYIKLLQKYNPNDASKVYRLK